MNPSESIYRTPGAGPRGPFQACFNLSGPPPRNSGSGSPLQHQHLFQVETYPLKPEVTSIAHPTHITAALHPIVALQSTENPFHGPANPGIEFIPPLLVLSYGSITPGPIDDATEYPPASQRLLAGVLGIGSIGKHRRFIAPDHLFESMRLGDAGRGQSQMPDQAAALIHAEVDLVTKVPVFASAGPIRVGVGAGFSPARRVGLGLDQSGVYQRTPSHDQPLSLELLLQQGKQGFSHPRLGQPVTEPANPRLIRNRVGKGQSQKTLKRQAIADGLFQAGIGQAVPLLQQQGFKHHHWRMAGTSLRGVIQRFQDLLEGPPVNLAVDLLQKVAFRHPTRGLQVPKAHLPRLFSHHLRPPVIDFNRRLPRYYNML